MKRQEPKSQLPYKVTASKLGELDDISVIKHGDLYVLRQIDLHYTTFQSNIVCHSFLSIGNPQEVVFELSFQKCPFFFLSLAAASLVPRLSHAHANKIFVKDVVYFICITSNE